jgi:predicted GNAT family N-acyltransferase
MCNLTVQRAVIPADLPKIYTIRSQVFQLEQGVSPELEFDGLDEQSDHWLAYIDATPVGTTRVRFPKAGTAKIERVAVLAHYRGQGIGRHLMEVVLAELSQGAIAEVQIHAQLRVQNFYERLDFVVEGAVFEEAGMPHVKMKKQLR